MTLLRPDRHPSWTCQHCGEEIGYLGRLMERITPVMFRHVCVHSVIHPIPSQQASISERTQRAYWDWELKRSTGVDPAAK